MPDLTPLLIELHARAGDAPFLLVSVVASVLLALWAIPRATDVMVNSIAGLAHRHFGARSRTLFINASTNNPEAFAMLVSFGLGKLGGWSNPLGSLLANIYLLYGGAVIVVVVKFAARGERDSLRRLRTLLRAEWRLLLGHMLVSLVMFGLGFTAMKLLMGAEGAPTLANSGSRALIAGALIAAGILGFFLLFERRLKGARPELYDDMDSSQFRASWRGFLGGTAAVIFTCWVMNELFLAWTDVYGTALARLFGPLVFAWLHYFLGALITSLPEMTVAVRNLGKLRGPDLNTAAGSVSYSNMVNLAIALIGLVLWAALSMAGVKFAWQ